MSDIWAIIPVKEFDGAKDRLSGLLSPQQRRVLAETMLTDMLDAVAGSRLGDVLKQNRLIRPQSESVFGRVRLKMRNGREFFSPTGFGGGFQRRGRRMIGGLFGFLHIGGDIRRFNAVVPQQLCGSLDRIAIGPIGWIARIAFHSFVEEQIGAQCFAGYLRLDRAHV